MVRAAASGAFNYAHADPYNKQWRLRHKFILQELVRASDEQTLRDAHQHWLAFVSHSRLEEEGWKNVKKKAADTLEELAKVVYSVETAGKKETRTPEDTIYEKYGDLIDSYRSMIAEEQRKKAE